VKEVLAEAITDGMQSARGPCGLPKDPTGPLRSRRVRQKRKVAPKPANARNSGIDRIVNQIKADDTVVMPSAEPVASVSDALASRVPWSVWPLAGTTWDSWRCR
jgi:hypothetical protein